MRRPWLVGLLVLSVILTLWSVEYRLTAVQPSFPISIFSRPDGTIHSFVGHVHCVIDEMLTKCGDRIDTFTNEEAALWRATRLP